MRILKVNYSNTNTYLMEGESGYLLFDTGWAGTFAAFCHAMGELNVPVQDIDCIMISHYHPDHMGIAQEIADLGPVILVADVQKDFVHSTDDIFDKEGNAAFKPIDESAVRIFDIDDSRSVLKEIGIDGQVLYTPGHSDDSISLLLDDSNLFVGDLNPLYEAELHKGTQIGESWEKLLAYNPKTVYYGHAKETSIDSAYGQQDDTDLHVLITQIIRMTDKGYDVDRICKKTGAEGGFIQDVMRMYLTHRNVGVQGILDRIEIKGR